MFLACGIDIPVSYFAIVERLTPNASASCCCFNPSLFLAVLKFSEKPIFLFSHKIKSAQPKPRTKNTWLDCCDTILHYQMHVKTEPVFLSMIKIQTSGNYYEIVSQKYYIIIKTKNPVDSEIFVLHNSEGLRRVFRIAGIDRHIILSLIKKKELV